MNTERILPKVIFVTLLHEELADRERALRDSRIRKKVGRIEERLGISTRGIFEKKNGRKSF